MACSHDSWASFKSEYDFGKTDGRLHLGLLPIPFMGNLDKASIFLMMLNPGVGPDDYYAEYNVPEFRDALLRNLRQEENNTFVCLDPRFSWHGGFYYWHNKLKGLITKYACKEHAYDTCEPEERALAYNKALQDFQTKIAVLQLMPYHSSNFELSEETFESMKSPCFAQSYVKEVLLPRAKRGECLIIATRRIQDWGLEDCESECVINYAGAETRGAHLGPNTRGGKRILEFLLEEQKSPAETNLLKSK